MDQEDHVRMLEENFQHCDICNALLIDENYKLLRLALPDDGEDWKDEVEPVLTACVGCFMTRPRRYIQVFT